MSAKELVVGGSVLARGRGRGRVSVVVTVDGDKAQLRTEKTLHVSGEHNTMRPLGR